MRKPDLARTLKHLRSVIGNGCRIMIQFNSSGEPQVTAAWNPELSENHEETPKKVPERWQEHEHDQRYFG